MKTRFIFPALLVFTLAASPMMVNAQIQEIEKMVMMKQDKVKLDPEQLPSAVKTSIAADETIADLTITEAWQITDEKGETHFKIKFDNLGKELVKKFDINGKEIKE
jgi:hypothetical protein